MGDVRIQNVTCSTTHKTKPCKVRKTEDIVKHLSNAASEQGLNDLAFALNDEYSEYIPKVL